jgi:hypothetical protein
MKRKPVVCACETEVEASSCEEFWENCTYPLRLPYEDKLMLLLFAIVYETEAGCAYLPSWIALFFVKNFRNKKDLSPLLREI